MRWRLIIGLAGCLAASGAAHGADPVVYQVQFAPSGDAALDGLLKQTSTLVSLRTKLPPAPFALIGRAKADAAQSLIVLHSLGYDAGQVNITIDGKALNDPALLSALSAAPPSQTVTVQVTPEKGPLFHIGKVTLAGMPPGFTPPPMVKTGDVALAGPVLEGGPALRSALGNKGYAFAQVAAPPLAVAMVQSQTLNVTYTIDPGPRVDVGPIGFTGLKRTDPDFLRRHISLRQGQSYSAARVARARDALLGLGVFSAVSAEPVREGDTQAPIMFHVVEQKRHAVSISGAYATDTGINISTSWVDRNLFRHAETLTLTATANGLGGTGTTAPGYDLKGVFAKPDYYARGQVLTLSLEGLKESLTAYDRTALLVGGNLSRPINRRIAITFGPSFTSESVAQEGVSRSYLLVQFPVTTTFNTTDSLLEPTRGVNASLTITPSAEVLGNTQLFALFQGSAATYIPVEDNGRGVVAVRVMAGTMLGATPFEVPPDQRFYAGGSGTVRGYTYQTIGPLFPDNTPQGGASMDAVNLEFRQHVWGNFGIVPFVDAGQVSTSSTPWGGEMRVGAGVGARYYTSIGPIRVDLAVPLARIPGSGSFALYVGLGEAF
jgi:translocation and assembly module TamA